MKMIEFHHRKTPSNRPQFSGKLNSEIDYPIRLMNQFTFTALFIKHCVVLIAPLTSITDRNCYLLSIAVGCWGIDAAANHLAAASRCEFINILICIILFGVCCCSWVWPAVRFGGFSPVSYPDRAHCSTYIFHWNCALRFSIQRFVS